MIPMVGPHSLDTIEDCIHLATVAHRGQKDKAGEPYILHPLRVMLTFSTNIERAAAVLHDVIEDTLVTLEDLHDLGLDPIARDAIEAVTRRPAEVYREFIARAGRDPISRAVKIADIMDNLTRLHRLPSIIEAQRLAVRYRTALKVLGVEEP